MASPAASTSETAARGSGRMRHVLSALVQNQPGVLAHVSGMLASRGFNIDSLAVGETEDANLSRMTFVVHGDDAELEQVRKQLDKVVTVVQVQDISSENFVERDLLLIKIKAAGQQRMEISLLIDMFRGRVVDVVMAGVGVAVGAVALALPVLFLLGAWLVGLPRWAMR